METAVKGGNPMNRKTIRISEKKAADHSTEIFLKRSASLRKQSVSCGAMKLCCARSGNKEAVSLPNRSLRI